MILAIFLIALMLIVSGYIKKIKSNNEPVEGQKEAAQDIVVKLDNINTEIIISNIDTNDWGIFYDDIFKIELKYPKNWEIKTNKDVINGSEEHSLIIDNGETVLFIKLLDDLADGAIESLKNNSTMKNIATDNYESYAVTRDNSMRRYWYSYFFKIGDQNYKIFYHSANIDYSVDATDVDDNEKNIVNNIISTIKFN